MLYVRSKIIISADNILDAHVMNVQRICEENRKREENRLNEEELELLVKEQRKQKSFEEAHAKFEELKKCFKPSELEELEATTIRGIDELTTALVKGQLAYCFIVLRLKLA